MGLGIRRTGASRATRMQGLAKLETTSRQEGHDKCVAQQRRAVSGARSSEREEAGWEGGLEGGGTP